MRRNVLQEITLFSYIRIRAGASPTALSLRVSQSEQLLLYTYVSFVHPESFGSRKKKQSTTGKLSPPAWSDRRSGKCHVRSFLRLSLDKRLTKLFNAIQSKHITRICCFYIIRYEECARFWFCIVHRRTASAIKLFVRNTPSFTSQWLHYHHNHHHRHIYVHCWSSLFADRNAATDLVTERKQKNPVRLSLC